MYSNYKRLIQGVDGVDSHPPCILQLHNFPLGLLPHSILGRLILNFPERHAPDPRSNRMLHEYGSYTIYIHGT